MSSVHTAADAVYERGNSVTLRAEVRNADKTPSPFMDADYVIGTLFSPSEVVLIDGIAPERYLQGRYRERWQSVDDSELGIYRWEVIVGVDGREQKLVYEFTVIDQ